MDVDKLTDAQVRAALKAVLDVHGPYTGSDHCVGGNGCDRWPCSTIVAIDKATQAN